MIDITYYCSQSDVQSLLSQEGVRLRLDDDQTGALSVAETEVLTQHRGWASQTVESYTWDRYAPAYLATSPLVQRWATVLCAYDLCARRGNAVPESLENQAERAQKDLEDIHEGRRRIPGIPQRRALAPAMSNTRFDPRYQFRVIRVERGTSTGPRSALPQVVDFQSAFWVEL